MREIPIVIILRFMIGYKRLSVVSMKCHGWQLGEQVSSHVPQTPPPRPQAGQAASANAIYSHPW